MQDKTRLLDGALACFSTAFFAACAHPFQPVFKHHSCPISLSSGAFVAFSSLISAKRLSCFVFVDIPVFLYIPITNSTRLGQLRRLVAAMDDQFGGRTDDDLFYDDDFEPVDGVTTIIPNDEPVEISSYYISQSSLVPHPADIESALAPLVAAAAAGRGQGKRRRKPKSPKSPKSPKAASPPPPPRGGLALSRFAEKPIAKPQTEAKQPPQQEPPSPKSTAPVTSHPQTSADNIPANQATNTPPPRNKRNNEKGSSKPTSGTADTRTQSGANPRQKLTEAELTAKMEKMKLVSAEKARKFEKAEKDEKQHAEAYARGMEEARKQRAENAAKRRQTEEQRRRLEEERMKNRERKLKAMSMKEGGWDEGKVAALEDESRRPFRGANGGTRGSKGGVRGTGGGLRGSRFARDANDGDKSATPDRTDTDKSVEERAPRGGGRNGRGRGGRGGGAGSNNNRNQHINPTLSKEDFPSLPPKNETQNEPVEGGPKPGIMAPLPRFAPAIGKWDDEMEFLDDMSSAAPAKS